MLVEMFSKIFFRNHIYRGVFENLTFQKFLAILYAIPTIACVMHVPGHALNCKLMYFPIYPIHWYNSTVKINCLISNYDIMIKSRG